MQLTSCMRLDLFFRNFPIYESTNPPGQQSLPPRRAGSEDVYKRQGLYEERTPLYEKYAQLTVDEETLGIRETVELVAEALKKE